MDADIGQDRYSAGGDAEQQGDRERECYRLVLDAQAEFVARSFRRSFRTSTGERSRIGR
jgi:hypothetical protein